MERFKQTQSIFRMIGVSIGVIALFFTLQFLGFYSASYRSLQSLGELHQMVKTITQVRQLRQLLTTEAEHFKKGAQSGLDSEAQTVLQETERQASALLEECLRVTAADAEVYGLILSAKSSLEAMRPEAERLLNGDNRKPSSLMIDQYFLEVQDFLGKVQLVLSDQSDRIFETVYRERFYPVIMGVVLTLLFLFFVFWLGMRVKKRLQRSIDNLVQATRIAARGDLSHRAEILEADEIGLLTAGFNQMVGQLKESTVSKEYVENILESMLNPVLVLSAEGGILKANRRTEEMFGYTRSELLGGQIEKIIPDYSSQAGGGKGFEGFGVTSAQKRFPVYVLVSSLDDKVVCVVRDITESKKFENEIRARNHALGLMNQELEAFSYSVSHDLRAPLRVIDGFSQALIEDADGALNEACRGHLDRIRAGVQRMGYLIDSVISLAKITRASMHLVPTNMSQIAKDVIRELAEVDSLRVVNCKIAENMVVNGDAVLLKMTLENLLGNAWKYTSKKEAAQIEFDCLEEKGLKVFRIRDNGAGFDMEYASKLFTPFQRLHSQSDFAGTGVGLASVRRVIQRHGGRIWAESKPEEGATFYFTIGGLESV